MHSPQPFGLFVDGPSVSDHDVAVTNALVRRVSNLRQVCGLDSLKLRYQLPGGGRLTVTDAGGVLKAHVVGQKYELPTVNDPTRGIATLEVPILYSGFIPIPTCPKGAGLTIRLTDQTMRRLAGYDDEKEGGQNVRALQRFEIDYPRHLQELGPEIPSESKTETQYQWVFPTWFTGAMSEVVQISGGWGKQPRGPRDEALPKDERRTLVIPEKWKIKILADLGGNTRLPGYLGKPPEDGHIQFDYKFMNTNGVSFDSKGKPWLIKVAPDGVWAMPLPTIPATTTQAFRDWMEEVQDTEILKILDRFKGIPSGEGFQQNLQAWRRAGVVIKVCEATAFFQHNIYTTACGFAFNRDGTEAFATCVEQGDPNQGLAFKLQLRMGSANEDGRLKDQAINFTDPGDAAKFDKYMSALFRQLKEFDGDAEAIKYKIRRHDAAALGAMVEAETPLAAWDDLEMPPIATHSGGITEVGRGNLIGYIPNPFWPAALILPEPMLKTPGCITLGGDHFTYPKGEDEGGNPKCDTIVYGFYDTEGRLKVIKYFREDGRPGKPSEEGPTCTYSGSWEWKGVTSGSVILGHFYTSDFDYRKPNDVGYSQYKTVGTHLYSSGWFIRQIDYFWKYFSAYRHEYYQIENWRVDFDFSSLRDAIAVPFGLRSAYVYVKEEADHLAGKRYSKEWVGLVNQHRFNYWTYDFSGAWAGEVPANWDVWPENYSPVYEDVPYRTQGAVFTSDCAPETEEGDWAPSTAEVSEAIRNGFPDTYKGAGGISNWHHPPKWSPVLKEEGPKIENETARVLFGYEGLPIDLPTGDNRPEYFKQYPDQSGNGFLLYGTAISFGDASYVYINEGNSHFGYSKYADRQRIPRFIGVINE